MSYPLWRVTLALRGNHSQAVDDETVDYDVSAVDLTAAMAQAEDQAEKDFSHLSHLRVGLTLKAECLTIGMWPNFQRPA